MVFGVNPGTLKSHEGFSAKLGLNFPLLHDPESKVAAKYGAVKEGGRSIQRTVVIVDKTGTVRYQRRGMPANQELLDVLRRL